MAAAGGPSFPLTDGSKWKAVTAPTGNSVAICFGAGRFVAVGNNVSMFSTDNGNTWTAGGTLGGLACNHVAFGNGAFVAAYGDSVNGPLSYARSTNGGVTWTTSQIAAAPYVAVSGMVYGAGAFVIMLSSGTACYTSPDGLTWTSRTTPDGYYSKPVFGGGQFGVFGVSTFATSPDGVTWTTVGNPSNGRAAVAYGAGVYAGTGSASEGSTSPTGATWTERTYAPSGTTWNDIAFGTSNFVAVASGTTGGATTSPNGIAWTSRTMPAAGTWSRIAYGNGVFVAIGPQPTVAVSTP
jgi:hypothetical protein